jgi:hypothetical protein
MAQNSNLKPASGKALSRFCELAQNVPTAAAISYRDNNFASHSHLIYESLWDLSDPSSNHYAVKRSMFRPADIPIPFLSMDQRWEMLQELWFALAEQLRMNFNSVAFWLLGAKNRYQLPWWLGSQPGTLNPFQSQELCHRV